MSCSVRVYDFSDIENCIINKDVNSIEFVIKKIKNNTKSINKIRMQYLSAENIDEIYEYLIDNDVLTERI